MILLSHVIDHYQKDLERTHGHEMLPSHHQALRAMRRCRREGSDHMLLECTSNATRSWISHQPQSDCRSPILWSLLQFRHNYGIHSGSIRKRCMIY